jgi:ferredoxin--NADP+ reductase
LGSIAIQSPDIDAMRASAVLRVAIVGSGPAGFYAADYLLKNQQLKVEVDMFERLPAPFGLVRFGVAPDHQSIKRVAAAFERTAQLPGFRYFGNVEIGRDITIEDLRRSYHEVLIATGSPTDRHLNVPGEDLEGSAAATSFVGWYNAHPDFCDLRFDFDAERAVIVGMGHVALDAARILLRDPQELEATDIPDYALQALRRSRIREVVLLGRRGPAQAAFDQGELFDIAQLANVDVLVEGTAEIPHFEHLDHAARKNVEYIAELMQAPRKDAARRLRLRFLTSPVELLGDSAGHVRALRVENNELVVRANGSVVAQGTGKLETLETRMVLRSIGYQGVQLPGLPFDPKAATIPNLHGRITEAPESGVIPGLYTVGWIKRGPTGLIGTNKLDAKETTELMLEDALQRLGTTSIPDRDAALKLLQHKGVRIVTFEDWHRLDELEQAAGKARGKVREKYAHIDEMLAALRRP